jgi:hypothetical protein
VPSVTFITPRCVCLSVFVCLIFFGSRTTESVRTFEISIRLPMVTPLPPRFSVCLFVRVCPFHGVRRTQETVRQTLRFHQIVPSVGHYSPRFSAVMSVFVRHTFFSPYGRTKSVRPYIEISIRLCHRSRLILQSFLCTICFVCVCSACSTDGIVRPYIEISIRFTVTFNKSDGFPNLWKFQFLQMYYPKVFCVVCLSVFLSVSFFASVRIWTESVQTRRLRLGLPSVTFNINLMEISIPSDVLPKVFCVFVCLLSVSFFLFRTDGRSPSTKICQIVPSVTFNITPECFLCMACLCVCPSHFFFEMFCTDGRSPSRPYIYLSDCATSQAYSHL